MLLAHGASEEMAKATIAAEADSAFNRHMTA